MKYYLIAGEASGDLHASNLIKALKHIDADADFRAMGGDTMKDVNDMRRKNIIKIGRNEFKATKKRCSQSIGINIDSLPTIKTIRRLFVKIKISVFVRCSGG